MSFFWIRSAVASIISVESEYKKPHLKISLSFYWQIFTRCYNSEEYYACLSIHLITDWVASQLLREQQLVKDLGNRRKEEKSASKKQKQKNEIITASKQLFCHLGGWPKKHTLFTFYIKICLLKRSCRRGVPQFSKMCFNNLFLQHIYI